MHATKKLWWVGVFAVAFAYMEAGVVVYLRQMYGIHDLLQDIPPLDPIIAPIEVGREFATLIMLMAVGWAVGKSRQTRLALSFFAFGIWDIFYYFWLKLLVNWPDSFLSTDILFLIPLPWWGPVISPILIAVLMIIGGSFTVFAEKHGRTVKFSAIELTALLGGILAILYSFMADAIAALPADIDVLSQLRPSSFNSYIYLVGLIITSSIVLRATWPIKQT